MMPGSRRWGFGFDAFLAAVIGVVAAIVAFGYVSAHYAPNTGDDDTYRSVSAMIAPYREDLLSPCVKRFGFMADADALLALPQWRAFVTRKTAAFPCGALGGVAIVPVAYNFELHRNLHRAMSSVFRLTGPRLIGFAWYQAIQYGIVLALLFGIFRLGMGRIVSALMMVPLIVSPRHLEMALAPNEYAKAPFFAASLLGVGVLVSLRLPARTAYGVALATGMAVGVGFGFKPDVLVFAPFGLIALAAFFRKTPDGANGRRALVIGAYVAGVVVAGAPLIQTHFFGSQRSLLPIQVLGGMAPAFTQEYANPPIYDYGVMFDDDYVIAAINSYNQRVNGSAEFGAFFTETIQRGATDLVLRLQSTFVADMLLRTSAAILQVFQFVPGGAIAAAVVLIWLCRVDTRLASFVVFALAYMVGYTSLVFAPKHYFHLEFVPWWFAGCIVGFAGAAVGRITAPRPLIDSSPDRRPRSWVSVFAIAAAALGIAAGVLVLARAYQDRQVRLMLTRYTQEDRFERLGIRSIATPTSAALLIPEKVSGDEGEPLPLAAGGLAPAFLSSKVETDYLALRVQCVGGASGDVVAVYRRPIYWRDSLTVPCERADQMWTVMWPVYQHLPQQVFEGFEYPGPALLRVNGISRVKDLDGYQLLLRLRLPDDWKERPLHHTLKLAAVSPARVRPVPAALSSPPPPLPPPAVAWDPPFAARLAPLATPAPRLDAWTALDGVSVTADGGRFLVQGNSSTYGYQLSSPPIAVPRHARIVVRVYGAVEAGRVAVGMLDQQGAHWLMPPVWRRSDFVANTGANDRVQLVFANARQPADEAVATRFFVDSISYDVETSALARLRTWLWPVAE
jgi:hypothetical protein